MSFPSSVLQKWDVGSTNAKLEGYSRAEYESRPFQSISLSQNEVTSTSGQTDAPASCHGSSKRIENSRLLYQDVVTFAVPFGGFLSVWHVVFFLSVPRIFRSAFNLDGQKAWFRAKETRQGPIGLQLTVNSCTRFLKELIAKFLCGRVTRFRGKVVDTRSLDQPLCSDTVTELDNSDRRIVTEAMSDLID